RRRRDVDRLHDGPRQARRAPAPQEPHRERHRDRGHARHPRRRAHRGEAGRAVCRHSDGPVSKHRRWRPLEGHPGGPRLAAHLCPRHPCEPARSARDVRVPQSRRAQPGRLALSQRRCGRNVEALRSRHQGRDDHDGRRAASDRRRPRLLRQPHGPGLRHGGRRPLVAGASAAPPRGGRLPAPLPPRRPRPGRHRLSRTNAASTTPPIMIPVAEGGSSMSVRSLLIAALALMYVATISPTPVRAASPDGTLTIGVHVTLVNRWLDPGETEALITPFMVLYAIHDALVKPMPKNIMTPSLAESWTASKDGLAYDFLIPKNAKFHNVDPVTAEDVNFTFERYKGASAKILKDHVKEIQTPAPNHVRFVLKEPWPDFMAFYGTSATGAAWIVPKKYIEKVGEDGFKKAPVGAGPYKFVSFQP